MNSGCMKNATLTVKGNGKRTQQLSNGTVGRDNIDTTVHVKQ